MRVASSLVLQMLRCSHGRCRMPVTLVLTAFQTPAPSIAHAAPTSLHCSIMHKSLMPTLILLLPAIFAPLSFALPIAAESHLLLADRRCDDSAWASWKAEHGKTYPSLQEDEERCAVFM